MSDTGSVPVFRRTLPLFDSQDRDVIQRLLHHTVEDFAYDHPDRKVARDLYHKIREGEGFRLYVGSDIDGANCLIVDPRLVDMPPDTIVARFTAEMGSHGGEWERIARNLEQWTTDHDIDRADVVFGFEYLH